MLAFKAGYGGWEKIPLVRRRRKMSKPPIDDLRGEPVKVPPKIYKRALKMLKLLLRQLEGVSWGRTDTSALQKIITDFEHANRTFRQK